MSETLTHVASGKVRDMYEMGDRILMVASDRISTYDVVHPTPIPDKGAVLTGLSAFWFSRTGQIVRNHFVSATDDEALEVLGFDARHRVEACFAGLPDQVAIRRLPHAELRHARADERDLPHGISPRSRRAASVCPRSSAMASAVVPSSARASASAPGASSVFSIAASPSKAAMCSGV